MTDETTVKTVSKPRVSTKPRKRQGSEDKWIKSDIEIGLDPEDFGPAAFAARPVGDITGSYETQEFELDEDKALYVHFTQPNQNLPKKRLFTVKAMKPNGVLTQLPFEDQIQNTAGGDTGDAIGLRRYQRKGYVIFWDFEKAQPLYCGAWGCYAQALNDGGAYRQFCGPAHAQVTLPNLYDSAGAVSQGLMAQGATTSRIWGS
jgi:hypothetical protein